MSAPHEQDWQVTLAVAVARYDDLRFRDSLASLDPLAPSPPLTSAEARELLALTETITRKVQYGRQLAVRSALRAGIRRGDIATALNTDPPTTWRDHIRWIDQQQDQWHRNAYEGLDAAEVATAYRPTADMRLVLPDIP